MMRAMDETALAHLRPPPVAVGEVVATGRTSGGLLVALEGYDETRTVATPSPYETWPDGAMHMPPLHGRLLVVVTDAAGESGVAGAVSWHAETYGPTEGSFAWNIGIGLAETCRGHGVGTVSQRLLGEWLLGTPLTGIALVSPLWESQQAFAGLWDYGSLIERSGMPSGWGAILRLTLITLIALALAVWRVAHMRPLAGDD